MVLCALILSCCNKAHKLERDTNTGQNAVQKLAIASVHVFLLRHHCIALPAVCSDPGARQGVDPFSEDSGTGGE